MVGLKPVSIGSRWWAGTDKRFKVIDVIKDDSGNTWVHYKNDKDNTAPEYSCYVEAFKERFSEVPE